VTSASVDADHAIRIIRARCSDALAPGDLDLVEAALNRNAVETITREVAERIAEVLAAMETRFAAMETRLETMEEAT
jgi:hypothetical protein